MFTTLEEYIGNMWKKRYAIKITSRCNYAVLEYCYNETNQKIWREKYDPRKCYIYTDDDGFVHCAEKAPSGYSIIIYSTLIKHYEMEEHEYMIITQQLYEPDKTDNFLSENGTNIVFHPHTVTSITNRIFTKEEENYHEKIC